MLLQVDLKDAKRAAGVIAPVHENCDLQLSVSDSVEAKLNKPSRKSRRWICKIRWRYCRGVKSSLMIGGFGRLRWHR